MQPDDRDREVLFGGRVRSRYLGGCRARLAATEPGREHREAKQRYDEERRESDPGKNILVVEQIDDPEDEAAGGEQEVAHDQRWADAITGVARLAHAAASEP